MSRDILVEELRRDRDAAIEEADYERQRAEIAAQRAETLRAETQRLRARVQELLDRPAAAPNSEGDDRLRLALDSNRRLERLRTRLEAELAKNDLQSALAGVLDELDELLLAGGDTGGAEAKLAEAKRGDKA